MDFMALAYIPEILQPSASFGAPKSLYLIASYPASAHRHQGGNFFMRQIFLAGLGRTADPMRQWMNEIPNDAIIRFHDWFRGERILLTSPNALTEVFVHNAYDFTKPPYFIRLIGGEKIRKFLLLSGLVFGMYVLISETNAMLTTENT